MVISNPCKYFRRYILAHEFIQRMNKTPNIDLYIVELEYGNNPVFEVTEKNNPCHSLFENFYYQRSNLIQLRRIAVYHMKSVKID